MKKGILRFGVFLFCTIWLIIPKVSGQELLLLDVNDGNRVVNNGVINVSTTDLTTLELSVHLKIVNQTDKAIAVFMKKIIHFQVDSTSNYFCLNPKCWPNSDSTNIADSIPAGTTDSSFVTHYDHFFVYEKPIPPGLTSITYLFYDHTTFPEPVEAKVTINYVVSGVGIQNGLTADVSLYPNPASGFTTFRYEIPPLCKQAHLSIRNMQGVEVSSFPLELKYGRVIIPTDYLPSGIYLLNLFTDGNNILSRKLSVQH
jgi:hypothetical protein